MMMTEIPTASAPTKTMKAVQASGYGEDVDRLLTVQDEVPIPSLQDEYRPVEDIHPLIRYATRLDRKTHMIIQTLAVALAPGDARVVSGKTRRLQGPPSFPYIPGGDCCGMVVEVAPDEPYFCVGDVVAARFTVAPRDALAQYARVSTSVCEKIPDDPKLLSPVAAAALASASPAVVLGDYVCPHERLLILGAGGGVGSHLCQVARARGAAVVVGVSCDPERLLRPPLLCHEAVDYTKENVFESVKYQNDPFDTIIDLACGGWPQLVDGARQKGRPSIVKPASAGGRYITLCPDQPTFEMHGLWGILRLFMLRPLWRALTSRIVTRNRLPTFTLANGLPSTREIMTRTLDLAARGQLQAVVDGPYPMTTDGVRAAFRTLQSRHAHGKVVIHVADLPPPPTTTTTTSQYS